jgi:hypothetical protein
LFLKSEVAFFFFFTPGALILTSSCSVHYVRAGCKAKVRREAKLSAGNAKTFS